ncbi:hypothetical protein AGMMS4956_21310 [Bacteroidia bacterium]|nr:hypothetical protein AGMMS4956_21310 [Bacteroidia bacterium]
MELPALKLDPETIVVNIIIVIAFIILVVYVVRSTIYRSRKNNLIKVETGRLAYKMRSANDPVPVDRLVHNGKQFIVNGKKHLTSNYILVRAEGAYMRDRGINDGDILYVRKFDEVFTREQIHPRDILLIYLNDKRYSGYKIRVFKQYNPEHPDEVETYYYNEDGTEHNSSKNHNVIDVKGIIKYRTTD